MKMLVTRTKLFVFCIILLLPIMAFATNPKNMKFSMEISNRLKYLSDGTQRDAAMDFSVARGCFDFQPRFTTDLRGRFNLDFYSSDKQTDTKGVSLKMKYAYLEYDNIIPDHKLYFGLIKNYFGTIYSWEYDTIYDDSTNYWGITSSADYGVAFQGNLNYLHGIEYTLGVYNGEGYSKAKGNVNNQFAYQANVRAITWEDNAHDASLELGLSYRLDSRGWTNTLDENEHAIDNMAHESINAFSLNGTLKYDKLKVISQYIGKNTETDNLVKTDAGYSDISVSVFSIFAMYEMDEYFNHDTDLMVRIDKFDENTDVADDGKLALILGANYHYNKNIHLQLNFKNVSYEAEGIDSSNEILFQLRYNFAKDNIF